MSSVHQPAYSINGHPASPQAFYAVACDPHRSVVVEACAGAGKTWILVSRILRALLDGAEPHQVLAITFTRKAAGEMRERLEQWLREFAMTDEESRIRALMDRGLAAEPATRAATVLAGLHERLLASGRAVEIRTFHGWFSQLLRAAPLEVLSELGLSPAVELIEDVDDLRADVFRRFHAAVRADDPVRDDFFALVQSRGRSQVRRWLEAAWIKRVEIERADAAGTLLTSVELPQELWPGFDGLGHPAARLRRPSVAGLLGEVARGLGAQSGATPRKQGGLLEQALALSDDLKALAAARDALFTKGQLRKKLDTPGLVEAAALLDEIQRAAEQHDARIEHLRMARLAQVLLREYAALKRQRGLADMSDLELCALWLLRDATLAGWVQERLDQRFRHVLIDEFQDTSPLQWQALHGWLAAYAGAGGGASGQRPPSVFIVGDPKQSIYRFRGAEPRVFAAARDFVAQALGGSVLECDHTRRNAPAVLAAVNGVFEAAGEQGAFVGFRQHTTGSEDVEGSAVQHLPLIERRDREGDPCAASTGWRDSLTTPRREPEQTLRADEAQQVARAVEALIGRDGFAPGEIFVLARRRALLAAAALALQTRHIPYVAPEDNALMDAPEVRDLVAVLDALASPGHDLSLAQALRSPLFGATDEDLLWLSQRGGPRRWWRALQEHASHASPALQRAAHLLARWASTMQQLPPHDLLDRIVAEGELMPRLLACVPAPRRSAAVEAVRELLGLSLQLDGARYATVYGFVRALKRRALKMAAGVVPDAVQLLTVHGAKGLEARAVILMDCDAGAPRSETSTLLVDWPVDADAPVRCAFVASESRGVPSLRDALDRERAAREREELNGLYVAMTRARERLVLSAVAPYQPAAEPSWWSRAVPHAVPWLPENASALGVVPARIEYLDLPDGPLFESAALNARPRANAVDERAALVGQALHRLLEWATAPQAGGADLPALAQAAAAAFGLEAAMAPELQQMASQVLQSPSVKQFFDPQAHAWAGNEVTLADGTELVRLDRLVAFDNEEGRTWWVLDYKLQSRPQAVASYREQMERYRAVLQRLQPNDRVRAAFITAGGELIEA